MKTFSASLNISAAVVVMAFVPVSLGCLGMTNRPLIAGPGPMNYQQANAVVHDPFPQEDLGPSDLGARPPSYQNPLPLPVRNRTVDDMMPWLKITDPAPPRYPGF
ncbi:membrane or secreted protein [Stieleria varia]|uniref:Membrane or secreted protein n=1 Tax=Stieleria varia TaxID=2528005 RepID=A0A5C6AS84_9BACT|nr:membrane or secreted protein [Stieleria varia]TWU02277.1 hypothetical protein Pla52n_33270 [Stieleria varia]